MIISCAIKVWKEGGPIIIITILINITIVQIVIKGWTVRKSSSCHDFQHRYHHHHPHDQNVDGVACRQATYPIKATAHMHCRDPHICAANGDEDHQKSSDMSWIEGVQNPSPSPKLSLFSC